MLIETEKRLSLVEFALKRRGYPRDEYVVSLKEVQNLPAGYSQSGVGIAKFDGKWAVYIFDRANRNQIAMHDSFSTAADEFYWRCTYAPSQYDFREEWEKETGLQFEIVYEE